MKGEGSQVPGDVVLRCLSPLTHGECPEAPSLDDSDWDGAVLPSEALVSLHMMAAFINNINQ